MELSDEEIDALAEQCWHEDHAGDLDFDAGKFARAILAAHEAKKQQQQDHQAQPFGVRTEPGEENAAGVNPSRGGGQE